MFLALRHCQILAVVISCPQGSSRTPARPGQHLRPGRPAAAVPLPAAAALAAAGRAAAADSTTALSGTITSVTHEPRLNMAYTPILQCQQHAAPTRGSGVSSRARRASAIACLASSLSGLPRGSRPAGWRCAGGEGWRWPLVGQPSSICGGCRCPCPCMAWAWGQFPHIMVVQLAATPGGTAMPPIKLPGDQHHVTACCTCDRLATLWF